MRGAQISFKVQPQGAVDLFQNREAVRQLEAEADRIESLGDTFDPASTTALDLYVRANELRAKAQCIKAECIKAESVAAIQAASVESPSETLERFFREDR